MVSGNLYVSGHFAEVMQASAQYFHKNYINCVTYKYVLPINKRVR